MTTEEALEAAVARAEEAEANCAALWDLVKEAASSCLCDDGCNRCIELHQRAKDIFPGDGWVSHEEHARALDELAAMKVRSM
jgi:hypothetical protein